MPHSPTYSSLSRLLNGDLRGPIFWIRILTACSQGLTASRCTCITWSAAFFACCAARVATVFYVYEWVCKTKYQGRGTPFWHMALWTVPHGLLIWLQGRSGTQVVSALCKFLEKLFLCEVDVQIGNGRLNYINGYVKKDHDAVEVGLGEYLQRNACSSWLSTCRLLCKSSPRLPEVAIVTRSCQNSFALILMCFSIHHSPWPW